MMPSKFGDVLDRYLSKILAVFALVFVRRQLCSSGRNSKSNLASRSTRELNVFPNYGILQEGLCLQICQCP